MNESEFNKHFLRMINLIAEEIENNDQDGTIDIDINADILSIENESGIYIINKQPSVREIWLSSPISGPHHFIFKNNIWQSRGGLEFLEILSSEFGLKITYKHE